MEIKEKQKQKKKIFFFFKNKNKNKNNLLSKKLTTKRIKYDIFIDITYYFSVIHDKIKNILIFNGNIPSNFIQKGKSYKKLGNIYVSNIKKISSGPEHSLILTKDNKLYAFGVNKDGRCGIDPYKYPIINLPMEIKYFKNIIDISCLHLHDVSFILLENGELYFFGAWTNTHIPQKIIIPHKIIKILSSGHSSYIMILEEHGKIYKFKRNKISPNFPYLSRLSEFNENDIKDFFFDKESKNFILFKNNLVYEQSEYYENFKKHEFPSFIQIEPGEQIIKIHSDIYRTIYLTNKSIYVDGNIKYIFDNIEKKYEIKFFRNKNIINFETLYGTMMSVSKDGIVYGLGKNNLIKTKSPTINKTIAYKYDSPIILYSS